MMHHHLDRDLAIHAWPDDPNCLGCEAERIERDAMANMYANRTRQIDKAVAKASGKKPKKTGAAAGKAVGDMLKKKQKKK